MVEDMHETLQPMAATTPHPHDTAPPFKAYLDWKFIKANVEKFKENVAQRNSSADPDLVVELYDKWRGLQDEAETLRSQRNENAKAMKVTL
jgi:hypothetical protein